MKICEYCGTEFNGEFYQPYCSNKCVGKACGLRYDNKKCQSCGLEFETLTDDSCCSIECSYNIPKRLKPTIQGI